MEYENNRVIIERGDTIRIFNSDKVKQGDLEATERIAIPAGAFKERDLSLEGKGE